jgi:hypothetical protein
LPNLEANKRLLTLALSLTLLALKSRLTIGFSQGGSGFLSGYSFRFQQPLMIFKGSLFKARTLAWGSFVASTRSFYAVLDPLLLTEFVEL